MKKYDYLIAYNFSCEGHLGVCSGTIQVSYDKKIKTFDDINKLNKFISESIDGASNVTIYNFILLGRNKH